MSVQMYPKSHVILIPKLKNVIQCVNHKVIWKQKQVVDKALLVVCGMINMDVFLMIIKNVEN